VSHATLQACADDGADYCRTGSEADIRSIDPPSAAENAIQAGEDWRSCGAAACTTGIFIRAEPVKNNKGRPIESHRNGELRAHSGEKL